MVNWESLNCFQTILQGPRRKKTNCVYCFQAKWVHIHLGWFCCPLPHEGIAWCFCDSPEERDLLHWGNWSSSDSSLHQKSYPSAATQSALPSETDGWQATFFTAPPQKNGLIKVSDRGQWSHVPLTGLRPVFRGGERQTIKSSSTRSTVWRSQNADEGSQIA